MDYVHGDCSPYLELVSGPFKAVVWMPEAMESWEQDIEFCIGCCHNDSFGLQLSKYGCRDLVQHRKIQMLDSVMTEHHITNYTREWIHSHFHTRQEVKVHQSLVSLSYRACDKVICYRSQ